LFAAAARRLRPQARRTASPVFFRGVGVEARGWAAVKAFEGWSDEGWFELGRGAWGGLISAVPVGTWGLPKLPLALKRQAIFGLSLPGRGCGAG